MKAQDVIGVMSRLFSKFDQMCEQHGVQKLHTLGDSYIVMGYTGKVAKDRRTMEDAIMEGYNVLQVAMQMLDIVAEERKRINSPYLKNLDLKVGIHTGRILGGIIGSKIVRYDIFGQDVVVAKNVEQHATVGTMFVSEQFHNLLKRKPFIWGTFDWDEIKKIKIDFSEKRVTLFRCDKIFAMDGSSSEELLEQGHDHMATKDMNKLSDRGHYAEEEQEGLKAHPQARVWPEDDFNG